jgi:hypothetical protein
MFEAEALFELIVGHPHLPEGRAGVWVLTRRNSCRDEPVHLPHIGLRIIVIDLTCLVHKLGLPVFQDFGCQLAKRCNRARKHLAFMIKNSQSQEPRCHSRLLLVRRYGKCACTGLMSEVRSDIFDEEFWICRQF